MGQICLEVPFKYRPVPIELFPPPIFHLIFPLPVVNGPLILGNWLLPLERVGLGVLKRPQSLVDMFDRRRTLLRQLGLRLFNSGLPLLQKFNIEVGLAINTLTSLTVAHLNY